MSEVTLILERIQKGDLHAATELWPLAARALGLAERTASRTWAYAQAWLHQELTRTQ